MTTFRSITSRTTLTAVVGFMVIATASYLAIVGSIDGPTYFGLALLVAGALFKNGSASKE